MPPRALAAALGLLTAACASAPHVAAPPPPVAARRSPCVITTDSVGPVRPIAAGFDDPSDARRARLAAGRLAPVRQDCEGRFLAGLARRWSRDTSGKFWTLELEPSAGMAADAPRWTAPALAATWRADPDATPVLRAAGVVSVVPLDDSRLVVGFTAPHDSLPAVFAARELGVGARDSSMLVESEPGSSDLRDAVDHGPDLIQTGDPDLLDYARRRPDVSITPLPWSRTYLLVIPPGTAGLGSAIPADTAEFRAALARDAVRTEARPAAAQGWADSAVRCRRTPAAQDAPPADVIATSADDRTARELAERLVALALTQGLAVRPLEQDSLPAALARGDARAFIVAAPRESSVPCADAAGWPPGATVIPLVETRRQAIVRRGAPPLAVEWDGAVRVAESGDTVAAAAGAAR